MIPEEKIREVADRLNIVEIIGEYIALKRSGANYLGLCPFHGEKTPSFNVNPARNIFHCFGCGAGGNVFSFVMKMEAISFPEAVLMLAKRAGIVIEERPFTPQERKQQDEQEEFYRITEMAAGYFRRLLTEQPEGETARNYLVGRGVTAETGKAYGLGAASDRRDGLVRYLERQRVSLTSAEKLGLIRLSASGTYHDMFRSRLMFPICDLRGRPVAFGGRSLGDAQPKYLNSPESPIYHKSSLLFGMHVARNAMRDQTGLIVVEGYFDHLALFQEGWKNVAATCGTALTESHLQLVKRFTRNLYLLFDGDAAGQKATERVLDLILGSGLSVRVIELPREHDPDTFLRQQGAELFGERVAAAPPIFEWYVQRTAAHVQTGNVAGKMALLEYLVPKLEKMTDPLERNLWTREISRRFAIDEQLIVKKLGRVTVTAADFSKKQPQTLREEPEDLMLALMGRSKEIALRIEAEGVEHYFSPTRQPLALNVISRIKGGDAVEWGAVIELAATPEEKRHLAGVLVNEERFSDIDEEKMFAELVTSHARRKLKRGEDLRRELARIEPGSERQTEILSQLNTLRKTKSQLL